MSHAEPDVPQQNRAQCQHEQARSSPAPGPASPRLVAVAQNDWHFSREGLTAQCCVASFICLQHSTNGDGIQKPAIHRSVQS